MANYLRVAKNWFSLISFRGTINSYFYPATDQGDENLLLPGVKSADIG
jgi:hypothetical protein